jgi:hypothetical protein
MTLHLPDRRGRSRSALYSSVATLEERSVLATIVVNGHGGAVY